MRAQKTRLAGSGVTVHAFGAAAAAPEESEEESGPVRGGDTEKERRLSPKTRQAVHSALRHLLLPSSTTTTIHGTITMCFLQLLLRPRYTTIHILLLLLLLLLLLVL